MNYDSGNIKALLKKMMEGQADPAEEARLRLALSLYTDEEMQELIAEVAEDIETGTDGERTSGENLIPPSFTAWKAEKKKRRASRIRKFLSRILVFFLVLFLTLWIIRRPAPQTGCDGAAGEEMPVANYSSSFILADRQEIKVDSHYTGRVSIQGAMEIVRTESGVIEYRRLNDSVLADSGSQMMNVLKTAPGEQNLLKLADGTLIRLNSGSAVRFPVSSAGEGRIAFVAGEVFFDVAADTAHPFVIHSESADLQLTEGRLNINTYQANATAITLVKGEATLSTDHDTVRLLPREQAVVPPRNSHVKTISVNREVDTLRFITWKNRQRVYPGITVSDFVVEMARLYKLEVRCLENLPDTRITVEYCSDSGIENLFRLFDDMGLKFTVKGRQVLFCGTGH